MRAADVAVGQEYAYVIPGRRGAARRAVSVVVLDAPVAGRVRVRVLDGLAALVDDSLASGAELQVSTRSLASAWADWKPEAPGPAVTDRLPELTTDDAVVHRLDDSKVLVLGNTELLAGVGQPLYTLTPELARAVGVELGGTFGTANAALQAASAVEGIRQTGLVFQVSKTSVAQFQQLEKVMSNGEMIGILRGDGSFRALVRWNQAGTGLRSLASISGLIFTAAMIAGQAHMQKRLVAMCAALDDLKEMNRDEQISQVRVASARMSKVVELAAELGGFRPALAAELPDRYQLELLLTRAAQEVARHNQRLGELPKKAGEKLDQLRMTVPDVMRALILYTEAENALMVAEALNRHAVAQTDLVTAAALQRYELRQREERVAAGIALADGLSEALAAVEGEPGSGLFAGGKRKKVRALAGQVRADLAALRTRTLAATGAVAATVTEQPQLR